MINIVLHSLVRWGVLIFGVWAVINAVSGVSKKTSFSKKDKLSVGKSTRFFQWGP